MQTANIFRSQTEGQITVYLIEFTEDWRRSAQARFIATWVKPGSELAKILPSFRSLVSKSTFYKIPDSPWKTKLSESPWGEHWPNGYYPMLIRQQAEVRYKELVLAARSGKTKFEVKD